MDPAKSVSPTNRSLPALAAFSNLQTDAARAMSRRVVRARFKLPERDDLTRLVVDIDRRLRLTLQAEDGSGLYGVVVQK